MFYFARENKTTEEGEEDEQRAEEEKKAMIIGNRGRAKKEDDDGGAWLYGEITATFTQNTGSKAIYSTRGFSSFSGSRNVAGGSGQDSTYKILVAGKVLPPTATFYF